MRLPVYLRRPRTAMLARWGRIPGLRTAKATFAAMLAYVVADLINTSQAPILASLTALLVVRLTVYETVAQGVQRVLSVLAGVLIALALAAVVGLHWWSLGAVVAIALVTGQILRLGPNTIEVPISAMLVLAVGGAGAGGAATGRVYETLIGAVVGVAVNFAVAPPVHVRPAGTAIGQLADRLAEFLRGLAGELRTDWSRAAAERWLTQARSLAPDVTRADKALARAEQSARLNPRGDEVREAQPRLRNALTSMEYCYIVLRTLCREIFDRTYYLPQEKETEAYGPEVRAALADVLERAAEAMCGVAQVASDAGPVETARATVHEHLVELHRRRDRLAELLLIDPHIDAAAWQQHGALLATVDRLRVEIEAAVRPASERWRPPPIGEGTRQAVRRVIDAAAEDALPLIAERPRQAVRRAVDVAAEVAAAAAAEAAANLAISDPRVQRRPTDDADRRAQPDRLPEPDRMAQPDRVGRPDRLAQPDRVAGSDPVPDADRAAEAATVAQVTAEMAAEAARIAAATAEAAQRAEQTAPAEEPPAGTQPDATSGTEATRPDGAENRPS